MRKDFFSPTLLKPVGRLPLDASKYSEDSKCWEPCPSSSPLQEGIHAKSHLTGLWVESKTGMSVSLCVVQTLISE